MEQKKRDFPLKLSLITFPLVLVGLWGFNPLRAFFYHSQANYLWQQEKRQEAIKNYEKAINYNPNYGEAYYALGEAFRQEGDLNKAISYFDQAIKINSKSDQVYLAKAEILQQQKNFSAALMNMEKAVQINEDLTQNKDLARIYYDLGLELTKEKKYAEAIVAYNKAVEIEPFYPIVYNKLGEVLREIERFEEAIAAFQKAITFSSSYAQAYHNLGLTYVKQDKLLEAIKAYQQAIKLDPTYIEIYNDLGSVLLKQGKVQEALFLHQKALSFNPNDSQTYNHIGKVFSQQGKLIEAIGFYQQAIKLNPKNADAYQNFCFTLHQQKKYQQAIQKCKQALKLNPNLQEVQFYLEEIPRQLALAQNSALKSSSENLPASKDLNLKRSVVKIISLGKTVRGIGTGWVIKKEGSNAWIVTNSHVVSKKGPKKKFRRIEVEYYSQPKSGQFRKRSVAKIWRRTKVDESLDLAILQVTDVPDDIQPLSLANDSPYLSQPVTVIGHPFTLKEWSTLTGQIQGIGKQNLKISVPLASGSSGSPVLNDNNEVIGLAVGVQPLCNQTFLDNLNLSCGVAFPIEVIKQKLLKWGI